MSGVPLAHRPRLQLLGDALEIGRDVQLPGSPIRPPALTGAAGPGSRRFRDQTSEGPHPNDLCPGPYLPPRPGQRGGPAVAGRLLRAELRHPRPQTDARLQDGPAQGWITGKPAAAAPKTTRRS